MACAHGLDDEDIGHDGENVMMRGEGSEPVDGEVVDPDNEDGKIDRQDPEHENE